MVASQALPPGTLSPVSAHLILLTTAIVGAMWVNPGQSLQPWGWGVGVCPIQSLTSVLSFPQEIVKHHQKVKHPLCLSQGFYCYDEAP